MRINWRNFLIGFTVFYVLVKFLQFLSFLGYLIQDLLHRDDDECKECIIQYLEIVFLSCLIVCILLLLYGAVKVNLQSLIKEVISTHNFAAKTISHWSVACGSYNFDSYRVPNTLFYENFWRLRYGIKNLYIGRVV